MEMKLNEDGTLSFNVDIYDFLDSLSDEKSIELAESLSCQDAVIKHVTDQLFDGYTENGCHGSKRGGDNPSTQLELSQEKVRKLGNRLLIKEVKRLRGKLEDKNSHFESGWNEYHKLNNKIRGFDV